MRQKRIEAFALSGNSAALSATIGGTKMQPNCLASITGEALLTI
jgi:hypothetical protein